MEEVKPIRKMVGFWEAQEIFVKQLEEAGRSLKIKEQTKKAEKKRQRKQHIDRVMTQISSCFKTTEKEASNSTDPSPYQYAIPILPTSHLYRPTPTITQRPITFIERYQYEYNLRKAESERLTASFTHISKRPITPSEIVLDIDLDDDNSSSASTNSLSDSASIITVIDLTLQPLNPLPIAPKPRMGVSSLRPFTPNAHASKSFPSTRRPRMGVSSLSQGNIAKKDGLSADVPNQMEGATKQTGACPETSAQCETKTPRGKGIRGLFQNIKHRIFGK